MSIYESPEYKCLLSFYQSPYPDKPGQNYCNTTWDNLLCWPVTPAGHISILPCDFTLNNVTYDENTTVTRECLPNATWADQANYLSCRALGELGTHNLEEDVHLTVATYLYIGGYSVSLVALLTAMIIFIAVRDLHCLRNTVHSNLMITYILLNVTWLIKASMSYSPSNSEISCFMGIALTYFLATNFFWMFIEGLYLYIMVLKPFYVDKLGFKIYFIIGWLCPALLMIIWMPVKWRISRNWKKSLDKQCPWHAEHPIDFMYQGPILLVLLMNVFFLSRILWILVRKIKASTTNTSSEWKQYSKAAKALVVLIPLLGVTYLVVLVQPSNRKAKQIFQIFQAFLLSTQGFAVAVLYCFVNGEVQSSLKLLYHRWKTSRQLESSRKQNTYKRMADMSINNQMKLKRNSTIEIGIGSDKSTQV